jgi:hypothetical protein
MQINKDKAVYGQARQLGEYLLLDALHRSLMQTSQIGSAAIVVDAKNESAQSFCLRYGFIQLPDHSKRLFLPMKTIETLFE